MKLIPFFTSLVLLCLPLMMVSNAHADRVEPTGRDTPVTATFDKSSAPPQINIWTDESGGYDTSNQGLWGRNSWVCVSDSSPTNGKCDTVPQWYGYGHTQVQLEFKEQKSGITQVINVSAYHKSASYGDLLSTAAAYYEGVSETKETAYISSSELQKLPVGGIWKAELKLILMQWDNPRNYPLANWNAHITLNVTDNNNQQIYLPEFGQAAPRVDLNMRPLPGTGGKQAQMDGAANIDMCLYDGYGSNSTSFTLKFDDQQQGTTQRNNGYFSIYSDHGDVNQDSGRIDYYVKMQAPDGKYVSIIRGEDLVIPNIQTARVRPVHLPGIPQAVLCIPAPLELSTKTLDINSKQAGHYTGHLIVNFTSQL
ncbi:CfaE/CblD family pilus tip adhesin [Rahnella perminowiae]|uniref:CfaE/CblD family pilus tip adhesin n=1 Tax=Rahnella perminowiae TaxID=2816244 RepID=UPI00215B90DB|nr:CfaE/CblD family pilus tip adhesin [Rahnella perminowiae]MCR9000140.1 pilus assembly protein CblD [Rahnella perminowiae]